MFFGLFLDENDTKSLKYFSKLKKHLDQKKDGCLQPPGPERVQALWSFGGQFFIFSTSDSF